MGKRGGEVQDDHNGGKERIECRERERVGDG